MIKRITTSIAIIALLSSLQAAADVATFTWSPVDDARVGVYVLGWGNKPAASKGIYGVGSVDAAAPAVTATTPDITKGVYYFAVKACTADKSLCSDWSNEVQVDMLGGIAIPPGLTLESLTFSVQ